ncbi:hypothetical protein HanLR1_Chr01g0009451 [Helianthus annuus]|nr:hypothetical protein HanHA89_Chr01g0010511 [Helianthus annuus]KAJ0782545.1 hypothetical protein HanLR1_Chr01g0009451 [Helianthus annuus]
MIGSTADLTSSSSGSVSRASEVSRSISIEAILTTASGMFGVHEGSSSSNSKFKSKSCLDSKMLLFLSFSAFLS